MRPSGWETTTLYPVWTNALPSSNYMLQDVLGSLWATLAFAAVLYAPGYLVGLGTDLFGFRRMRFAERSVWAVALSFCVAPVLAYLTGRVAGLSGVCWLFGGATLGTLGMFARPSGRGSWSGRELKISALIGGGWILTTLLLLIDFQVGHKLYFSVVMADQSYRIAFTDAVVRTGIPPANPLYFAGSLAPMRYYYFWYVLCAAVVKMAHVSARQAFVASSVWAGFGLMATVWLFTRHFFRWERRQRWIAVGLLLISGADLIPAVGQSLLQPALNGDTEWWSVDPIDSWPDSLLWVPHHVASVLCCLLGFLLLWRTLETLPAKGSRWAVVLAGLAFASALGLSVYVAFGFALLATAWLGWLLVRRSPQRFPLLRRNAIAGLFSAALLVPFFRELAVGLATPGANSPSAANEPAAHLFSFSVRRMIDSELITGLPAFASWHQAHPVLLDQTVRLLLLLPGLAMELGLYGAILVWLLLAKRRGAPMAQDDAREISLFFVVCGLVLTMFLSSSVITNNDFGYRAVMLPQFFLVLLAADVFGSWWLPGKVPVVPSTRTRRGLVYTLVTLAAAGLLYWAILLRAWLPIEASRPQNGFSRLPEDNYQIREAFETLDRSAPAAAVVVFRPIDPTPDRQGEVMAPNEYYQRMLVMDTGRQMLNAEGKCATHFGGDPRPCVAIQNATTELYQLPAPGADWARAFCRRFGVSYLVLSSWYPDWVAGSGWPVGLPVAVSEPRIKVFACR